MPKFAFPVSISTYYFYSFKPVSIPDASGGTSDFQNGALAVRADIAGYSSQEQIMFV